MRLLKFQTAGPIHEKTCWPWNFWFAQQIFKEDNLDRACVSVCVCICPSQAIHRKLLKSSSSNWHGDCIGHDNASYNYDYVGSMFECYSQRFKVDMRECAPWMVTRPARAPYKYCNYYYYYYYYVLILLTLTFIRCHTDAVLNVRLCQKVFKQCRSRLFWR